MKKKIISYIRSIRFRIFIIIVILGILPITIMEEAVHNYYKSEIISNSTAGLQTQAAIAADDISEYSDFSETGINVIAPILQQYSMVNEARVMLVNMDYKIVFDSYSVEKNKTIISENVIKAFETQKSISQYKKDSGCIEITRPVVAQNSSVTCVIVFEFSTQTIVGFASDVSQKTYIIKIALVMFLVFFAEMSARLITKSIDDTMEDVNLIAIGHYDKRLNVNGYSELERFAESFNGIMDTMHNLDESRQEFVSNVSHELKTPITSMKVLADALNTQEDAPIELYREFMHDIVDEIDRESKIIDDLLSLVKMDKSAAKLNITSTNINEMLELILKRLKPIAQKKNIELLFESFRPVVAEIDEVKLSLAISNLVENAIKYNRVDGWVHVSLNADHQYFYIRVEDNGIGIPKEQQSKVYDRFYRVDKARSRETGGTGLGLAIVKNSILMHQGAIKLHSEENVGTTFTVRIPLNHVE